MADDILDRLPVDVTPSKAGWRSKVPIMACGAGLFSDGYLNGVCVFNSILSLCFVNVHETLPRLLVWSILYSSGCGKMNMVLINSALLLLYVPSSSNSYQTLIISKRQRWLLIFLTTYKYRSGLLESFSVNYPLDLSLTNTREKRGCWLPVSFSSLSVSWRLLRRELGHAFKAL